MKNIIKYSWILLLLIVSSCKKDEKFSFDEKPNVRIQKTLDAFQKALVNNDGWIANIYTKASTGQAYSFYFQFKDNGRVVMMSDIDSITSTVPKESSYRLKWLEQPTLIFDTYNYIHRLADPMPDNQGGSAGVGGTPGQGLISDFEFGLTAEAVIALNSDPNVQSFTTIGRYNSVPVTFTRATTAEASYWKNGEINKEMKGISALVKNNPYLYASTDDGNKIQFSFDFVNKQLSENLAVNNTISSGTTPFVFGVNNLSLRDSVNVNGNLTTMITWENQQLFAVLNGKKSLIKSSDVPIIPILLLFGKGFKTITIPNATTYPGWSDDYVARRAQAALAIKTGGYNLDLGKMLHAFNPNDSTLLITVDIPQNGTLYLATFPYKYNLSSDGKFKFTPLPGYNGNAGLIIGNLAPLFAERFDVDTFTLQYYAAPDGRVLAQFTSIDHPDYSFTGTYQ
ncbi:MAG: DUF4302 domain-containing protein [Ginsengibacter sp.]